MNYDISQQCAHIDDRKGVLCSPETGKISSFERPRDDVSIAFICAVSLVIRRYKAPPFDVK